MPLRRHKGNLINMQLTDQNFQEEIKKSDKPVLVDFFATWCGPCAVLGPILEKIAKESNGEFILEKVNVDFFPLTCQKFGINVMPTVVLFKEGNPVSGFTGLISEAAVKEWLQKTLATESNDAAAMANIVKDSEVYAKKAGIKLNPNTKVVENIHKGLLNNEKKYNKRYCPCRRVTGNALEDEKSVCPCFWHLEEIAKDGKCLCGLFVKGE